MNLVSSYRLRKLASAVPAGAVKQPLSKLTRGGLIAAGLTAAGGLGYGAYKMRKKDKALPTSLSGSINPDLANTLGLAGGGAIAGALAGGLLSKENKLRNALLGATIGGIGGYAVDMGRRKYFGA